MTAGMKPDETTRNANARKEIEMASANAHCVGGVRVPKVGDIFSNSWGYDQTNVDWYEVVRVSKASVWIRAIKSKTTETGMMCGESVPCPGEFVGPEEIKRIKFVNNEPWLNFPYGAGKLWDGKPRYKSWYA